MCLVIAVHVGRQGQTLDLGGQIRALLSELELIAYDQTGALCHGIICILSRTSQHHFQCIYRPVHRTAGEIENY